MENAPEEKEEIFTEETARKIGQLTLFDVPRDFWWVETGMGKEEIPRFGWEALGKDF